MYRLAGKRRYPFSVKQKYVGPYQCVNELTIESNSFVCDREDFLWKGVETNVVKLKN